MVRLRSPNRPTGPGVFSRREFWRLLSLVLGVALVGYLIRELNRPQVAARLDQVLAVSAESASDDIAPPPDDIAPPPAMIPADPAQFRKLLELAGWDAKRFSSIQGEPREALAELLWRLNTFDGPQLAAWARAATPQEHAGELVALAGRVTKAERHALPADLATRLEMPAYFECEMMLDGRGMATIVTGRIPNAWLKMSSLDERSVAAGVFVTRLPAAAGDDDGMPNGLFVSRDIAWHPDRPHEPFVSLGKSVLGGLGVDVGLLDSVRQRRPISAAEREAFYQLLDGVGRIGANQLTRFAEQGLATVQKRWAADEQRPQLAQEVQARAAEGRYSVAPLFNDAKNQVGELVTLDGTARRVTRIDVGKSPAGATSDVARRFGIDHYYEIDLFTDDSQNNPIVFCVRELPPGMPLGDGLHEPVRIAGIFFKNWSFQSRRATLPAAPDGAPTAAGLRQIAPLVIGRSPILLEPYNPKSDAYAGYFAAVLFLFLLAVVWAAGWWLARDDRRFVETTRTKQFSLAEGESLNDLDLGHDPGTRENG